jgi:hypothetical protein
VKVLQILLAFIGGSAAIYGGLENGYAVGFFALMCAVVGGVMIPEGIRNLVAYARGRRRRSQ